ncbi:hypothetical protein G8E03_01550 [Pontibrevibacter nitratireducens]|uniref:Uncharacterized protein n=1 Tax=Pontivivens nitratireducens TaxID=2758038 RepID=A0A6G7VHR5_9RHOB|nr:hypothetical protein G8E03_01550 [Pontibrevibacter nitratireducens]
MSGVDLNGNTLSGNNEQFRLNAEILNVPLKKTALVERLVDKFMQLRADGAINAPKADYNSSKISKLKTLL